jgi:hypothetical protein
MRKSIVVLIVAPLAVAFHGFDSGSAYLDILAFA